MSVIMYLLPQKIEVWYIIPAIRKELALLLTRDHGLSFEKAGAILGVSKAAVSQYLSNKRANKITLSSDIKEEIAVSGEIIASENKLAVREIERLLKVMKTSKRSCEVCKIYNKGVLEFCGGVPNY